MFNRINHYQDDGIFNGCKYVFDKGAHRALCGCGEFVSGQKQPETGSLLA